LKYDTEKTSAWIEAMALSDSQAAFGSLYAACYKRLIRFTRLYLPSDADAEEVVSDTFLSLWNSRKLLPGISNFDAWLYSVARNKAISYYRSQYGMETVGLEENDTDLSLRTATTPEDELIAREDADRLNAAVDTLPAKCRAVFKLVREDRLKYREVATILHISVKTVEAHLATAVRKLREALHDGDRENRGKA
jgi:RNA polymerase sigma-70 factor (ECF subfamily)